MRISRSTIGSPVRAGDSTLTLGAPLPCSARSSRRLGHYRLEQEIGRGGSGVVYRARDLRNGAVAAIKMLPASATFHPDRVMRLRREAKLLALLDHPNIARYHDIFERDGRPHLVLEYLPGEDLSVRLRRDALTVDESLRIVSAVAHALASAHASGIIHRDLKPSNVRLTDSGAVKVLDFGLAKLVTAGDTSAHGSEPSEVSKQEDATLFGGLMGTPSYMSPEQVRGETVDVRTDAWALGCVLFECLSGERPFAASERGERLTSILIADPNWDLLPEDVTVSARRLLRRCLGKDPAGRPAMLEVALELERLRADRVNPLPGQRSERSAGNLPKPGTKLIGREEELRALLDRIEASRLVALTGPVGCGKSALARQVAWDFCVERRWEAWLVDASTLTQADDFANDMARQLRLAGPLDACANFIAAHADRPLLLILDGVDAVAAAVPALVSRLLQACPHLRILATGRTPFDCPAESVSPVLPLSFPLGPFGEPPASSRVLALIAESAAGRLFAARAREAAPGFRVTRSNAHEVARIVRGLDGRPLAIELAAARLNSQSLAVIAQDVDHTDSSSEAGLVWGLESLTADETELLRRLSAFAGSFTLAAAESVAAAPPLEPSYVLDGLVRLVGRALVEVDRSLEEVRYRLRVPLRDEVRARLVGADCADAAQERHLNYYHAVAVAEGWAPAARPSAYRVPRLETDLQEFRAALERPGARRVGRALEMATALRELWWARGLFAEGNAHLQRLLGAAPPSAPDAVRGRAWLVAAVLTQAQGQHRDALAYANAAVAAFERCGDTGGNGESLYVRSNSLGCLGLPDEARADLERALALARTIDNTARIATYLSRMGGIARLHGDLEQAAILFREALDQARNIADPPLNLMLLNNLGLVELDRGALETALARFDEALSMAREQQREREVAVVLANLAVTWMELDVLERARAMAEEALAIDRKVGTRQREVTDLDILAEILLLQGKFDEAKLLFESVIAQSVCIGVMKEGHEANGQIGLAKIALARGDHGGAKTFLRRALVRARGDAGPREDALEVHAALRLAEGCPDAAAEELGASSASRARRGAFASRRFRVERESLAAELSAHLGVSRYTDAIHFGRELGLEAAVERAVAEDFVSA